MVYVMYFLFICVVLSYAIEACDLMTSRNRVERTSGEYRNARTGERQIQYQGSTEQKRDLDAIDAYSRNHSDF